jgi:hypothetical protein
MKKSSLKKIIRLKADFIVQAAKMEGIDLPQYMRQIDELANKAQQMPTRGFKQRERRDAVYAEIDQKIKKLILRLGNAVLDSYHFCGANEALLSDEQVKELFGK